GLTPSCSPTRRSAPDRVTGSRRRSTAIRIARSRSSSGYFLGAAMTLILPWNESLHQTRYATRHVSTVLAQALAGTKDPKRRLELVNRVVEEFAADQDVLEPLEQLLSVHRSELAHTQD